MEHIHENSPIHAALMVRQFLTNNNNAVLMSHRPYSPDPATLDLNLVPRMNRSLKGKRLNDVDEIKKYICTSTGLNGILPQEFQNCFER
ncbi:hypothetical protein TNCV_3757371 [Trichonephila clavipes]|nr:hypothetical protein TNCV_3757371 [Trichonephila clavipes]